jgi:hypothetical protein
VEGEPTRCGLVDEMGVGETLQQAAGLGGVAAASAPACAVKSVPGTSPSNRNSRCAGAGIDRYDRSNATRTAVSSSPSTANAANRFPPRN